MKARIDPSNDEASDSEQDVNGDECPSKSLRPVTEVRGSRGRGAYLEAWHREIHHFDENTWICGNVQSEEGDERRYDKILLITRQEEDTVDHWLI